MIVLADADPTYAPSLASVARLQQLVVVLTQRLRTATADSAATMARTYMAGFSDGYEAALRDLAALEEVMPS